MLVNALHIFLHKTSLPAQTISLAIMSTGSPIKSEEKTIVISLKNRILQFIIKLQLVHPNAIDSTSISFGNLVRFPPWSSKLFSLPGGGYTLRVTSETLLLKF